MTGMMGRREQPPAAGRRINKGAGVLNKSESAGRKGWPLLMEGGLSCWGFLSKATVQPTGFPEGVRCPVSSTGHCPEPPGAPGLLLPTNPPAAFLRRGYSVRGLVQKGGAPALAARAPPSGRCCPALCAHADTRRTAMAREWPPT